MTHGTNVIANIARNVKGALHKLLSIKFIFQMSTLSVLSVRNVDVVVLITLNSKPLVRDEGLYCIEVLSR